MSDLERRMTLSAHLQEFQKRLKYSLLYFSGGLVVAFIFRKPLLSLVRHPHEWAMRQLDLSTAMYVIRYQDNFMSQIKICLLAGFVLAFPFILYEVLLFIGPGLKPKERKSLLFIYLPVLLLLFILGGIFSYMLLIPYGLHFLALFGSDVGLSPMINFADYVTLFSMLVLMSGFIFELPLFMILLSRLGVVRSSTFRQYRRYAILSAMVIAAILTPPDPVTQIFMALPLIVLYELGAVAARLLEKKRELISDIGR